MGKRGKRKGEEETLMEVMKKLDAAIKRLKEEELKSVKVYKVKKPKQGR